MTQLPRIVFNRFTDIQVVRGDELIEQLATSYSEVGQDETMVVTRSNKRANIYNNGIRAQILWREEPLESGDMLMVAKNNYYWSEQLTLELIANAKTEGKAPEEAERVPFDFIANGDTAIVRRVRNERQFYGFTFVDATLEFPDFNDFQMQLTLLTDSRGSSPHQGTTGFII